jgi:hypothetical protein
MGGEAALIAELGAAHRHDHPGPDVVAESHGAKKARAVDPKFLADRECCGHDRAAGMRTRGVVGIIGLVGMRHDAVGERSIGRCSRKHRAGDSRSTLSTVCADIALGRLARQQFRSGDYRRERVE